MLPEEVKSGCVVVFPQDVHLVIPTQRLLTMGTERIFLLLAFSVLSSLTLGRNSETTSSTTSSPERWIFVNTPRSWTDANAYCQSTYGTTLATITSDMEAQQLAELQDFDDNNK